MCIGRFYGSKAIWSWHSRTDTHALSEGLKGFDWGRLEVQNSVIATQQNVSKQSDHPQHGAHWDVVSLNSGGAFRRPVLIYPSALDFSGICSLVGNPGLRCGADTGLIELWWVCQRVEYLLMVLCRLCPASVLLMHSALSKVTETSHC